MPGRRSLRGRPVPLGCSPVWHARTKAIVSIDGKTARGSKDGEVPGQHLVAAYVADAQAVLAQIRVDAKTNEHKAALQLLGILPVRAYIFTGDAMFCQRDFCAAIINGGGDYVFFVKDNQPSLAVDIGAGLAFEDAGTAASSRFFPPGGPAAAPRARWRPRRNKGHGRLEKRTLRTTTILTKTQEWPGLKQGFELTRERTEKGERRWRWLRDHQPDRGAGGRGTTAGVDPRTLGDRERPALPP